MTVIAVRKRTRRIARGSLAMAVALVAGWSASGPASGEGADAKGSWSVVAGAHCDGGPKGWLRVRSRSLGPGIAGRFVVRNAVAGDVWSIEYSIERRLASGDTVWRDVLAVATVNANGRALVTYTDGAARRYRLHFAGVSNSEAQGCAASLTVRP